PYGQGGGQAQQVPLQVGTRQASFSTRQQVHSRQADGQGSPLQLGGPAQPRQGGQQGGEQGGSGDDQGGVAGGGVLETDAEQQLVGADAHQAHQDGAQPLAAAHGPLAAQAPDDRHQGQGGQGEANQQEGHRIDFPVGILDDGVGAAPYGGHGQHGRVGCSKGCSMSIAGHRPLTGKGHNRPFAAGGAYPAPSLPSVPAFLPCRRSV